jgi:hypothetical protein
MRMGEETGFASMLEPVVILPEQVRRPARLGARESSAFRLMVGVLDDAVDLYRMACDPHGRMPPRHRRELNAWFESTERQWPFSFERICEVLGMDPDGVRRRLRAQHGTILVARTRISRIDRTVRPLPAGGLPDRLAASS